MDVNDLDHDFYDLQSRRLRGGGHYLLDAALLLGDGTTVKFEDGFAYKVPATQAAQVLSIRPDIYANPCADQTPIKAEDKSLTPTMVEDDFDPLPLGAIAGNPVAIAAAVVDGHKVPPGRPELSPEEIERRRAEGEAYLAQLPVSERPPAPDAPPAAPEGRTVMAADGQPILIPFGVEPGVTPGWPISSETGEPLRLHPEQRRVAAQDLIAKTGTDLAPVLGTIEPQAPAVALEPTGDSGTNPAGPVLLAPVPQGFDVKTGADQARCLAAKADGSQCQNAARPPEFPQACQMPPHQEQVAAAAQAAAAIPA